MEMYKLKARCSGLADLMVKPKSGNGISATAKSAVRKIVKYDLFGYQDFEGNKYTEKGIALEELAIKLSGRKRGLALKKNEERRENDWITGECDIYVPTRKLIIDTKCSWDIGSHPFFTDEAEEKAKKQVIQSRCKAICGYGIVKRLKLTLYFYLLHTSNYQAMTTRHDTLI